LSYYKFPITCAHSYVSSKLGESEYSVEAVNAAFFSDSLLDLFDVDPCAGTKNLPPREYFGSAFILRAIKQDPDKALEAFWNALQLRRKWEKSQIGQARIVALKWADENMLPDGSLADPPDATALIEMGKTYGYSFFGYKDITNALEEIRRFQRESRSDADAAIPPEVS